MRPGEARSVLTALAEEATPGVFHCRSWGQNVDGKIVDALEVLAANEPSGKARLCMHPSTDDFEQQMLVAISGSCEDAVHFHPAKSETVVWVRGVAEHCIYDQQGAILRRTALGPEGALYVHTKPGVLHNVVVESEVLVFWEFARGPFAEGSTVPHVLAGP